MENNSILGTGNIRKLIAKFAIPCVLCSLIQAFYNIVDQIFIGQHPTLGAAGNAATGVIFPIMIIATAIGVWLGDGSAANISISQGRKDTKNLTKSIGTVITIGAVLASVLCLLCFIFQDNILMLIGAKDNFAYSKEYSYFIFGGLPFLVVTGVIVPIIRADGSPKYAMISSGIGGILNIILDPILIFAFNMGITGASLATFISQFVSMALCIAYLFRSKTFKLTKADFIPRIQLFGNVAKLGLSSLFTQLAMVITAIFTNIILSTYAASNGYDSNITQSVVSIATKTFSICFYICLGTIAGAQPIISYNYGAKNYDRVKHAFRIVLIVTTIVGVLYTLLVEIFPQSMLYIFGDGGFSDPSKKELYKQFLVITFRVYLSLSLLTLYCKVISFYFQCIGKPIKSVVIGLGRDIVFVIPLTLILCSFMGVYGFLLSGPICDLIVFAISLTLLILEFKKYNVESFENKNQIKR